ncbi:MAG: sulfopyruvate decarboxylase subunit beta [Methanotrichaceae archaeon]
MRRIEAIATVASVAGDALIICNIGFPSRELYAVKDRPENFYMLGSMGMASSIGLGLALSQQHRVIVLDGDGSVLMNLGTLATIATCAPDNYHLVILDNCAYGSTGLQPTCTSCRTDLAKVAKAAGINEVSSATTEEELKAALSSGVTVIIAKVDPGNADVPIIDLTPEQIIERFRGMLLKAPGLGR